MRGFTLIELLVVVMILALVATTVPPLLSRGVGSQLQSSVRELATGLRWARSEAVSERRSVALWVDTAGKSYRVETRDRRFQLPRDAKLLVNTAEHETRGRQAAIRFFPDGSSSGGSIELGAGGVTFEVRVDWLTGAVHVARLGDG
jgi:general secretion pathway protein H